MTLYEYVNTHTKTLLYKKHMSHTYEILWFKHLQSSRTSSIHIHHPQSHKRWANNKLRFFSKQFANEKKLLSTEYYVTHLRVSGICLCMCVCYAIRFFMIFILPGNWRIRLLSVLIISTKLQSFRTHHVGFLYFGFEQTPQTQTNTQFRDTWLIVCDSTQPTHKFHILCVTLNPNMLSSLFLHSVPIRIIHAGDSSGGSNLPAAIGGET